MTQQILFTTDNQGAPILHEYTTESTSQPTNPLDSITSPSNHTFVFNAASDLESAFANPQTHSLLTTHIRSIRLLILHQVSNATLTEEEKNGQVEGPNMTPLVDAWWAASRAIPKGHGIEHVVFDLSCGQDIERREIVRLLQGMSTTLSVKSKGAFRCEVDGCVGAGKEWLEGSLVCVRG